ncbi:30S ribosomal protein S5 [Candidatus Micrarchaeota archaeon]|nr:30S ribosomal protein S5 [Candidatus Micrarchaeota archaeon]
MAEKIRPIDVASWSPKTEIGKMVKTGQITSLEQVFDLGKPILEPEIVDALIPNMEVETLSVRSTQRVTDSGKRTQFRVVVVIGDHNGHVGIGVGKSDEMKPALDYAVRNSKKNVISIKKGCGSWECKCSVTHSLVQKTMGKQGSTIVNLKPAPRGLGLAANSIVRKVLSMAGVNDVWSSSQGAGGNIYNTAIATIKALDSLNKLKTPPFETGG